MTRIYTRRRPCWFLRNLVQVKGSVFPVSAVVSLPSAIVAAVLHVVWSDMMSEDEKEETILTNNAVWSGFTFLLGFLVVFRTSHAYNRWWEACSSVHKMGAEWFDCCSALMAFTRTSSCDAGTVYDFQSKAVRLFSMLHAAALSELEDLDNGSEESHVEGFGMELVDAGSFDDETLAALRDSTCRVELIYQWIQSIVVEAESRGVLSIPPPILSRAFQELSNGMVSFHDAIKVADTPFPFPYAQTCDALLVVLYICAPFVVSTYVSTWYLAFFFDFLYVFTFTGLTFTGLELEFPFGKDDNDIKKLEIHLEVNHKLRMLVTRNAWRLPTLRLREAVEAPDGVEEQTGTESIHMLRRLTQDSIACRSSFYDLWAQLPPPAQETNDMPRSPSGHNSVRRFGMKDSPGPTGSFYAGDAEKKGARKNSGVSMKKATSRGSRSARQKLSRSGTSTIDQENYVGTLQRQEGPGASSHSVGSFQLQMQTDDPVSRGGQRHSRGADQLVAEEQRTEEAVPTRDDSTQSFAM